MRERRYDTYEQDTRDGLRRFWKWLASQPMTSWGFFAAGFVIARILF